MHSIEYISCRVCGSNESKFLGIRGNREYPGLPDSGSFQEHIFTNVLRCKRCGFVYTNPLIIYKRDGYNDPNYYLSSSTVGAETLFNSTLDFIEKYAGKGKILDVGCGKGEFLSVAKKRGWETYGLEPSINLARFASEKVGLNIEVASLENSKYPDGFFDLVTLNMVLEHIDNPGRFLSVIKRILKKEGALFIEVPNMDSLMLKIAALYYRLKGKRWSPLLSPLHYPFHCYGYNISSIEHLLKGKHFRVEDALIRDSSLRGFRPDSGGTRTEKFLRNIITKMAGFIGKGDILMVVAKNR